MYCVKKLIRATVEEAFCLKVWGSTQLAPRGMFDGPPERLGKWTQEQQYKAIRDKLAYMSRTRPTSLFLSLVFFGNKRHTELSEHFHSFKIMLRREQRYILLCFCFIYIYFFFFSVRSPTVCEIRSETNSLNVVILVKVSPRDENVL